MGYVPLHKLMCLKCGHSWFPRTPEVKQCPNCRTTYFNINRGHLSDKKFIKEATENNKNFFKDNNDTGK